MASKASPRNAKNFPVPTSTAAVGAKGGGALTAELDKAKRVLERPRAENTTAARSAEVLNATLTILNEVNKDKSPGFKALLDQLLKNDIFASDKFIRSLGEKDMEKDALLIPIVFEKFATSIETKLIPNAVIHLFSAALFWPSYKVRSEAWKVVDTSVSNNLQLSCSLMSALLNKLQSGWLDDLVDRLKKHICANSEKEFNGVAGKDICRFISCLLDGHAKWLHHRTVSESDECVQFLILSLSICSLEKAAEYKGSIWIGWIHKCESYRKLLASADFCDKMVTQLLTNEDLDAKESKPQTDGDSRVNLVKLLVSLGESDHAMCDAIWRFCTVSCRAIDVERCVKMEDADVAIFKTANGVLYNTDVIEQNADDAISIKNMKRESKAIRESIQKLHDSVNDALLVLNVAARYYPKGAFRNVQLLYDVVVPLLRSKVISEIAVNAFMAFRDAFYDFSSDYLHGKPALLLFADRQMTRTQRHIYPLIEEEVEKLTPEQELERAKSKHFEVGLDNIMELELASRKIHYQLQGEAQKVHSFSVRRSNGKLANGAIAFAGSDVSKILRRVAHELSAENSADPYNRDAYNSINKVVDFICDHVYGQNGDDLTFLLIVVNKIARFEHDSVFYVCPTLATSGRKYECRVLSENFGAIGSGCRAAKICILRAPAFQDFPTKKAYATLEEVHKHIKVIFQIASMNDYSTSDKASGYVITKGEDGVRPINIDGTVFTEMLHLPQKTLNPQNGDINMPHNPDPQYQLADW